MKLNEIIKRIAEVEAALQNENTLFVFYKQECRDTANFTNRVSSVIEQKEKYRVPNGM